jgi:glutathione peroxidase
LVSTGTGELISALRGNNIRKDVKMMRIALTVLLALIGTSAMASDDSAERASDICPVLVGETVPNVQVRDVDGREVMLHEVLAGKPTVIIFYRGGWCPFCNTHLGQLKEAEADLAQLGHRIIAISPDRPEKLAESAGKIAMNYQLLSDSTMGAARAFGIAFKVADETLQDYKKWNIDLEAASGESHHELPVPAVYLVDTEGVIQFSYVNPNYRVRLDPEILMAAVKVQADKRRAQSSKNINPICGFTVRDIDGKDVELSEFEGKVLLVVNVASKCGFTPQYEGLQELYAKYKDKGFVVLGFPSNDFGRQEPGSNEQIKAFCTTTYGVQFPMFAKIAVKGENKHALYKYLTEKSSNPTYGGEITWNFNKFLIGRDGSIIARYESKVEPDDAALMTAIDRALAE